MPKRTADEYASDDGFVADAPTTTSSKRTKSSTSPNPTTSKANALKSSSSKATINPSQQTDDNSDPFWELSSGGTRRVTVNTFKGKTMVNIREYYEKDGQKLPGKKGISLPVEQWVALLEAAPGIEKEIVGRGEECGRPDYGAENGDAEAEGGGVRPDGKGKEAADDGDEEKKNFEATSEEDSG